MPDEPSKLPQTDQSSYATPQQLRPRPVDSGPTESFETAPNVQSTDKSSSEQTKRPGIEWPAIFETAPEIARHTVALLLSLFSLWLIHLVMKHLLGDPKFFGLIPVQWIIDVADIIILIKFIWHLIKNFNK